jgi:hypothetical protein
LLNLSEYSSVLFDPKEFRGKNIANASFFGLLELGCGVTFIIDATSMTRSLELHLYKQDASLEGGFTQRQL